MKSELEMRIQTKKQRLAELDYLSVREKDYELEMASKGATAEEIAAFKKKYYEDHKEAFEEKEGLRIQVKELEAEIENSKPISERIGHIKNGG